MTESKERTVERRRVFIDGLIEQLGIARSAENWWALMRKTFGDAYDAGVLAGQQQERAECRKWLYERSAKTDSLLVQQTLRYAADDLAAAIRERKDSPHE